MSFLSSDELASLAGNPQPKPTAPAIDPPSPEVMGKARELLNRLLEPKRPAVQDDPVDPEDKRQFLGFILTQTRFCKTYQLLGGAVKLTFGTMTERTKELTIRAAAEHAKLEKASGALDRELFVLSGYQAIASLRTIESDGKVVEYGVGDVEDLATLRKEYHAITSGLPDPLFEIIRNQYGRFCNLVDTLIGRADDPSFWTTPSSVS